MSDTKVPVEVHKAPAADSPSVPSEMKRLEHLQEAIGRLDRVLVGVVLLFAFLLASFAIRNSDYWLHLATGRLIATGDYSFGVDPFAYTTTGVYWTNHSWFFDLLLYGLTMLAGGPLGHGGAAAVICKALGMTGLAAVLLRIHRPGQGPWLPVICTILALMTMAPRMLLQPVGISLLFLGLTLWILVREGKPAPAPGSKRWAVLMSSSPRRLYALPALFVLWVNLDSWFFLGPITVALYWLGEKLQSVLAPIRQGADVADADEPRTLGRVVGLGLVACWFSPHHWHAFGTWPAELFPGMRFPRFKDDLNFASLFVSPFEKRYFEPSFGLNFTGMAYFPLLAIGVLSFWLTRQHWRTWRLVVWSAFALATIPSIQLIPFFAVVAGPITALNLQDFLAADLGPDAKDDIAARKLSLACRLITLVVAIGLLVAVWPGWLQAFPGDPRLERRVGWSVEVDPSLKKTAGQLESWRNQGLLGPNDHGFNLTPGVAHYCAWFCPRQRNFFDSRFDLFSQAAPDYVDAGQGLFRSGPAANLPPSLVPDWSKIFRTHGINHVVLSGPSWEKIEPYAARFLYDPDQWTPLYLDGRTSIFGWKDPQQKGPDRFAALRYDPQPRVFGRRTEPVVVRGPGRPPHPRTFVDRYLTAAPASSLAVDESAMLITYFKALGQQWQQQHLTEWRNIAAASIIGTTDPHGGGLPFLAGFVGRFYFNSHLLYSYLGEYDLGPPAALPLSVRAARQSLAESPDDPDSYLGLAKAIEFLSQHQENWWARIGGTASFGPRELLQILDGNPNFMQHPSPWVNRSIPFRQVVRQVQILTAWHNALALEPSSARIHGFLANVYWHMNYYDISQEHLRQQVELLKSADPPRRTMQVKAELLEREKLLADRQNEMLDLQRHFELQVAGQPPKRQALAAFQIYGLPKQALEILEREDVTTMSPQEADQMIYLILTLGRAEELRDQLVETQKKFLGPLTFEMHRVVQSAAVGDLELAGQALEQALALQTKPELPPVLGILQAMTMGRFQPYVLTRNTQIVWLQDQMVKSRTAYLVQQQEKDLQVLRGLFALEQGEAATADRFFRLALEFNGLPLDFESRRIAEHYRSFLKASGRH